MSKTAEIGCYKYVLDYLDLDNGKDMSTYFEWVIYNWRKVDEENITLYNYEQLKKKIISESVKSILPF